MEDLQKLRDELRDMSDFKMIILPTSNFLTKHAWSCCDLLTGAFCEPHFPQLVQHLQESFVCDPSRASSCPSKDRFFRARPPRLAKTLAPWSLKLPL